jgi:hypothetical protein
MGFTRGAESIASTVVEAALPVIRPAIRNEEIQRSPRRSRGTLRSNLCTSCVHQRDMAIVEMK